MQSAQNKDRHTVSAVDWRKEKHNLKVLSSVLFRDLTEDYSP